MSADGEISTIDMAIPIEAHSISQNLDKSVAETLKDTSKKSNRSLVYKGTSKTTAWRNLKQADAVDDRQKLTCFGFTTSSSAPSPITHEIKYSRSEIELIKIRSMFAKLEEFTKVVMNSKREGSNVDSYNYVRYLSISHYFSKRLEGKKVGEASFAAAEVFWKKNNKFYRAETIVAWAKEFLREGKLSNHSQGVHTKRTSFLNDSDY
ncbi:hypothetical protein BDF21DRAFT_18872 [Thamnidium elegans]|nr:hypothetical protein BDF21DRAFT_18872 [Thamnidium elegans]